MTVCYLEVDDEITTAIARLRVVDDGEAIVVVPSGSRIASSRINFKLLAREANERRLNIVTVSDEPAVRALAISAGLPAYDSLAGAEQALANFREQDRRLAERIGRAADEIPAQPAAPRAPGGAVGETRVLPSPLVDAPRVDGTPRPPLETQILATDTPGETAVPARRRRRRRVPVAPIFVIGFMALLIGGVAYGAYLFLPTASITLRPAANEMTLEPIAVSADPDVAVVDAPAGVVPAERIELALRVSGSFPATGVEARETRATGTVRFRSENTVEIVDVAQGTSVATADGVEFTTTSAASVPRADFATSTPGTVDVPVRAARVGPRGNVAAGAITELPNALATQLVSVRNPEPTTGGSRVEENVVAQDDFDAAVAALNAQLVTALAVRLADPSSVPRGLTAYAETATITQSQPDQQAAALVGSVAESFNLGLDAVGRVTAVNETLIDEVAAARLRDELPAGRQVVNDDVSVSRPPGQPSGDVVRYSATPSALVYSAPDDAELVALVSGKTVGEAEAILSRYGMVEITMWPEFVDRLPEQTTRIRLTVAPPSSGS